MLWSTESFGFSGRVQAYAFNGGRWRQSLGGSCRPSPTNRDYWSSQNNYDESQCSGKSSGGRPYSNIPLSAATGGVSNDDMEPDEEESLLGATEETPEIITKEMFLRDMLQDPQVLKKKKKKNGGTYQPMDNRDHLPFVVQVMQPDPYTKRQVIQEKARQRTKEENAKSTKKRKSKAPPGVTSSIASSLQLQQQDGSTQILGEFALDKSTTSGDWILIGDIEYQVTSAKCQYKYAGGKRFVMVRKILQVKEIRRLEQEAQLLRQLQATPEVDVDATVLVDMWEDDASTTM